MSRKNFPKSVLTARFAHAGGCCEWIDAETKIRCNAVLVPGRWEGDHDNPDGLTGEPTFENCRALCKAHHLEKTKQDVANIAKAKRREAKHVGADKPKGQIKSAGFAKAERKHEGREPAPGQSEIARRFGGKP